jgi:hypothetical protein
MMEDGRVVTCCFLERLDYPVLQIERVKVEERPAEESVAKRLIEGMDMDPSGMLLFDEEAPRIDLTSGGPFLRRSKSGVFPWMCGSKRTQLLRNMLFLDVVNSKIVSCSLIKVVEAITSG